MNKTSTFSNINISNLLRSVAAAYLLKNENRFKIIAYDKAADTIEHLSREVKEIWQDGKLDTIPGLGPSIRASLEEYFKNGKSEHFDAVIGSVPAPVFLLMKVPSLGPKKAFKMVKALGLEKSTSIFTDIQKAAQNNLIASIESFGEKSQQDILEAIQRYEKNQDKEQRMPLPYAHKQAMQIIEYLKKNPAVIRADALGSMRRMSSTIGDIDIAVGIKGHDIGDLISYFLAYPNKIAVDNAGDEKASIIIPPNIRVDLRAQDIDNYGSMLQYFTGNKLHNIKLRELAMKKGYSLSEHGIKTMKDGKEVGAIKIFKDEEGFYNFLGFQYVPPELREGEGELAIAFKKALPKLVELSDLKGDLHTHSSYDLKPSHDFGAHSYEELLDKAASLGYEYMGFSDHNPKISGHTNEDIIKIMKTRKKYIESLFKNGTHKGVHYFISLETDILPSGELALPEEAIEYVDYLVVSVHSSFGMNKEDMTHRVLKALSYPKVKVLGHPTGRLLNKRSGYELDWKQIFEYTSKKNIAIEINSWPERLDLPDILVHEALGYGVKFVIDTDAHAVPQMDNMRYGVSVARRGWTTKNDIINTLEYRDFEDWLKK